MGSVFSLDDNNGDLLFVELRDSNGRFWVGKRWDATKSTEVEKFIWYAQKVWDPASPCVKHACESDTLYVSFWTNGQIQMDEIVKYLGSENLKAVHTYDWETGLLNFGLPQFAYPSAPGFKDPIALPSFWDIGYIHLTPMRGNRFNSPPILGETEYPAMPLTRFTVFANQEGGRGFGFLSREQMLRYQNKSTSGRAIIDMTTNEGWTTCSSGLFERPAGMPPAESEQYDPSQLPAPCTVPSTPTNIAAIRTSGGVEVGWEAPGFAGTAFPNQQAKVTSYRVEVRQNNKVTVGCAVQSHFREFCSIGSGQINVNAPFDLGVTAYRNDGTNTNSTAFPSATQWAHFGVPVTPNYAQEVSGAVNQAIMAGQIFTAPMETPHLNPSGVIHAMANTPPNFTFVIAHLGAHSEPGCPENSVCAMQEAFNAGADGIQFDIKVTADGEAVLGHDEAVARELNNWTRDGAQTRDPKFPLKNYPLRDGIYANLTRPPFLIGFDNKNAAGEIRVDPNDPTRSSMNAADLQQSMLVDSYNQPSPLFHQLTLFQALYLMPQFYNMTAWIKVDSVDELLAAGRAIAAARRIRGAVGPLEKIGIKLNWSTLMHPLVYGDPGSAIGQNGIVYLLQIGTGDFDTIARWFGSTSTYRSEAEYVIRVALTGPQMANIACRDIGDDDYSGCLGVEVADKYPGAPTNWFVNMYRSNAPGMQVAIQQPAQEYSWHWSTLPDDGSREHAYGKAYPRPDGTCCASLNDELASSFFFGAETQDNRNLPAWVERSQYSTITTDTPLSVLRDLNRLGKRPRAVAEQIGGGNVKAVSGGKDKLTIDEGLYNFVWQGSYLMASGSGNSAVPMLGNSPRITPAMWYVTPRKDGLYTIVNAGISEGLAWKVPSKGAKLPALGTCCGKSQGEFIWKISPYLGTKLSIATEDGKQYLSNWNGKNWVVSLAKSPGTWEAVPVGAPVASSAQVQQLGPPGYVFRAAVGQEYLVPNVSSIAYGADGHFVHIFTEPPDRQTCTSAGTNLGSGLVNCFSSTFLENPSLDPAFERVNPKDMPVTGDFAFGSVEQIAGTKVGFFTYKRFSDMKHPFECAADSFDLDPNPQDFNKTCYVLKGTASIQEGPPGFVFCAQQGNQCVFSATAAIAYGSNGNFTYKMFSNGIACDNKSFDVDPNPGVTKSCFYKAATPVGDLDSKYLPVSFRNCEDLKCSEAPLGSLMAWGEAKGETTPIVIAYTTKTSSFECGLSAFLWDPDSNANKACYWAPQSWVNRGPAGFTFCAREGEVCRYNGVAQMAFGADGNYVFLPHEYTQTVCTAEHFGKDPYPEMKEKACFYRQP